jgi:hypothetical protein
MSATNSSWFYAAKMFVTFEVITAAVFAAAAAASASASASAATVLLGQNLKNSNQFCSLSNMVPPKALEAKL